MVKKNNVVSFAEKLKAREQSLTNKGSAKVEQSSDDIAEDIIQKVQEEVKRQKENSEIWCDTLDDFFDDLETINDITSFASFLSWYSTSLLSDLLDSANPDDEVVTSVVATSIVGNYKDVEKLIEKIEKKTNKKDK